MKVFEPFYSMRYTISRSLFWASEEECPCGDTLARKTFPVIVHVPIDCEHMVNQD